jgi:hypothetical protein
MPSSNSKSGKNVTLSLLPPPIAFKRFSPNKNPNTSLKSALRKARVSPIKNRKSHSPIKNRMSYSPIKRTSLLVAKNSFSPSQRYIKTRIEGVLYDTKEMIDIPIKRRRAHLLPGASEVSRAIKESASRARSSVALREASKAAHEKSIALPSIKELMTRFLSKASKRRILPVTETIGGKSKKKVLKRRNPKKI